MVLNNHLDLNYKHNLLSNHNQNTLLHNLNNHNDIDTLKNLIHLKEVNNFNSLNDLNKRNNASVPTLTSTATTMTSTPSQAAVMPGAESFRTSANQSTVNVGWLVGTTSR